MLTDQWFVAVETLVKPAIEAVENGSIQFVPKQWENTYFAWMRDLKTGVSPASFGGVTGFSFYDEAGNIYVAEDEEAARKKYNLASDVSLARRRRPGHVVLVSTLDFFNTRLAR